jgi:hypothetical protein
MKTARPARILPIAFSTLLAACGGGSDAPPPELLWQSAAEQSGDGAGLLTLSFSLRPAAAFSLSGPATGEECVEGEVRQTVTGAGEVIARVEPFGLAVRSGALVITRTATAAGVLTFPFRLCRAEDRGTATLDASVRVTLQPSNGRTLGAYTASARWTYIGSYR